jgi:hypothetical protein
MYLEGKLGKRRDQVLAELTFWVEEQRVHFNAVLSAQMLSIDVRETLFQIGGEFNSNSPGDEE